MVNQAESRNVSIPLGIGIFFLPWLFSWFTLRKGYSSVARAVAFGWGLLGLVGIVMTPASEGEAETSAGVALAQKNEPAVKVNAVDFAKAFDENEMRATQKYKGKLLQVTGVVEEVTTDISDDPVVELTGTDMLMGVQAHNLSKEYAASLDKGQTITLICVCDGELLGMPMLIECVESK